MATGKTTVGIALAEQLDFIFVDTDLLIEAEHGPIPAIFEAHGEAGFRQLEGEAVESLVGTSGLVIATGGGLVTIDATATRLAEIATIITLSASPETIVHRATAEGATRPLLAAGSHDSPAERVRALLAERADIYGRYPAVDSDRPVADVVASIIELTAPTEP